MTRRSLPLALALSGMALGVHAADAQPVRYAATIGRSAIVPPLPLPPVALNASPATFLLAARSAVEGNRLGEAQEGLERAETRLLDRSVVPAAAGVPNGQVAVVDIGVARRSLAVGDRAGALRAIDDARRALEASPIQPQRPPLTVVVRAVPLGLPIQLGPPVQAVPQVARPVQVAPPVPVGRPIQPNPAPPQTVAGGPVPLWPPTQLGPPVQPAPPAPPQVQFAPPVPAGPPLPPPVTYALLPGHWQLDGARYVWIPPDRIPRRVVAQRFLPNQYVWRDGRWVFVPQHYAAP